jgi:imidazolonepropionase-like amidohydrolase
VRESELKKDRDIAEAQRQNFCKAVKAGVKQVYATDAGIFPHGDNARQFAVMVRYCATPLLAIQSATITAADALGQTGQVGEIKAGAWGDLIGVQGDPLSNVRVLETVKFVMKGGEVVKGP